MAAPAALLDALAVAAAERLGAESAERLQSLHQMKKDYFPDAFIFQDNTRILHAFYCTAVVGIHRM